MELRKWLKSIESEAFLVLGALLIFAALGLQLAPETQKGEDSVMVSLSLEKPNVTLDRGLEIPVNSTVFDAVNQSFSVEYEEYSFGYFLTSVDGLSENGTHSWVYRVNNESPSKAVNRFRLQEGDNVSLIYSSTD